MSLPEETFIILLHGDMDFSQQERQIVSEAVDRWYEFTNGKFLFHIIYDISKYDLDALTKDDIILKVASSFYLVKESEQRSKGRTCGLCHRFTNRGNIYMVENRVRNYQTFRTVLMHELGHYIGLDHTEGPSIMYEYTDQTGDFTKNDALAFCEEYGCGLNELRYREVPL